VNPTAYSAERAVAVSAEHHRGIYPLLFQVTGAFAEFERSMIRQRVQAGLNSSGRRLPATRSSQRRLALSAAVLVSLAPYRINWSKPEPCSPAARASRTPPRAAA